MECRQGIPSKTNIHMSLGDLSKYNSNAEDKAKWPGHLWPFMRLGGLSKFHAMPIFTVQAVKVRKIFGMWVKFLFHAVKNSRLKWKFHIVKKVIIAVKSFSHCEI